MTHPAAGSEASVRRRLETLGLIPVVELKSVDEAVPLLDALSRAGLPAAEITLRSPAGLGAIEALRISHPDALVGVGTVTALKELDLAIAAGAQFVVSPVTNPELIERCKQLDLLVMPGACTPTEIDTAARAGAELVKFFPAEAMGGVGFLKALAGPFRDVSFVPTGGINASNLGEYLRLPQVVACGGSWIVAPALLRERRFDQIETLTREALAIVAETRGDE